MNMYDDEHLPRLINDDKKYTESEMTVKLNDFWKLNIAYRSGKLLSISDPQQYDYFINLSPESLDYGLNSIINGTYPLPPIEYDSIKCLHYMISRLSIIGQLNYDYYILGKDTSETLGDMRITPSALEIKSVLHCCHSMATIK